MASDQQWNTSYVCGIDNESGWGERYFFSYYTQFDADVHTVVGEVTTLLSIFIVSVVANVSIALCVFRFPEMRTVTNCLVLNLATADLLFAGTIPAVAYARVVSSSWQLGGVACRLVPYIQFVSGTVLLWTLTLISKDRHRCIVVPPYRSKMTPREAFTSSVIVWICAALACLPIAFWFRTVLIHQHHQHHHQHPPQQHHHTPHHFDSGAKICTLVFPRFAYLPNTTTCFVMPVVLFVCLLPMMMLVYHYERIFNKILSTRGAWASSCVVVSTKESGKRGANGSVVNSTALHPKSSNVGGRRQSELSVTDIFVPWPRKYSTTLPPYSSSTLPSGRHGSMSQQEELRINRHIKVVRLLFVNVVVVLVMWIPIIVVILLIFIDGQRAHNDTGFFLQSRHFVTALIIAFLNTAVNPLLYGVLSDSFRIAFRRMWCCPMDRTASKKETMDFGLPSGATVGKLQDTATPSTGRFN